MNKPKGYLCNNCKKVNPFAKDTETRAEAKKCVFCKTEKGFVLFYEGD